MIHDILDVKIEQLNL